MNKEQNNNWKSKWLKPALVIIFVLALISTIFFKLTPTKAASYTSTQSGNWSDIATWGGVGPPGTGDTVTISAGHTVTLTASATAGTVTIASTGILALGSSGYILTLDGAVATPLTVTGTLSPGTNSTVKYTSVNAGGNVNIATTTYNNLQFTPASAESYDMTGSLTTTNAMTGSLTIDANATLKTYVGTTSYDISCVNVTVNTSGTLYSGNSTSGTSIFTLSGVSSTWSGVGTFTYGTSTVNLTGSGIVRGLFYNLSAAADGKTTTVGSGGASVTNVLTLGSTGTLTGIGLVLIGAGTPLVTGGSSINNNISYKTDFSANITSANYAGGLILRGNGATYTAAGAISASSLEMNYGGTSRKTFNTNNQTITVSGDLKMGPAGSNYPGTLSATGSASISIGGNVTINYGTNDGQNIIDLSTYTGTMSIGGNYINSDTLTAGTSSTVQFTKASGTQTLNSGGTAAANIFNNLTHSGAGTLQLITNDLKATGNFINSGGTFDTNTKNVTVGGNVNLTTGSYTQGTTTMTLNGSAAQSFTAGGTGTGHTPYNLTVTNASASGITFADSLTLATGGTFTDSITDSIGDSHLTFNAGSTYTIPNLTMNGTSGHKIVLRSSSVTNYWNLNVANAPTVSYVDVSDSDATGATVTANNSTNSGHNLNWTFNEVVSGSLYDAIGGSKITAAKTINVSVNGGAIDSGTTSSGDYTIILASSLNANDIVTVFVSGDTVKASTITKVNNTGSFTGINLFQNYTTTRNETGISQLTNTDLATADNLADTDILFSVGGGNAVTFTQGVYIPATFTYNPMGGITTPGNWNGTGTFTASSYQVVFSGAGTQTLDAGGTGAGHFFNGLTHDGAGTLQLLTNNLDVDGNFLNSAGTFDTNGKDISVAGNVDLTGGTLTQGTRTITLDGSGTQSFTAGGTGAGHTPYNLMVTNASASGVTFLDSLTLATGGTFTDSTGDSNLTFNAGSTYTIPTLIMDGTAGHNITLRSSSPGTYWNLNVSNAPTLTYIDAQDSDAHTGAAILANMSIDSHHNVNWTISWYDVNWQYRKAITVDNTAGGVLTNYQVKVTLNNTNFDFSKAKTDGTDIRFTDSDKTTQISYWTESYDSVGQTAVLWPKVPSIPASSSKIIYMYYGNSNPGSYEYSKITIDSATHNDYGLAYPITYEFSIPSGSSVLKVYKRYTEAQAWTQITEKTSSDFFNGIEAVRFDYPANKAYISVAYSDTSDEIHLKVTSASDEITDITYQGIPDYYDNRDAVVTVTGDDWYGTEAYNTGFKNASDALRNRNIWFTPGIEVLGSREINGLPVVWSEVQPKIDAGQLEIASHSREHLGDNTNSIGYYYSGTHTGDNNEPQVLTDSEASLPTVGGKLVGWEINNTTDGSSCTITANNATTITCSGGLSGGTDNDWDNGDIYVIDRYDEEIGGSKSDIISNLDLPVLDKKGDQGYVLAWLEPYGYSNATIQQKIGEYKYITDRTITENNDSFSAATFANGHYTVGGSLWLETNYLTAANNKYNAVIAAHGIYHIMMHPRLNNWTVGSWQLQHLDYIKEKKNLWYVGFGQLYLYHYIDDQNKNSVSNIGGGSNSTISDPQTIEPEPLTTVGLEDTTLPSVTVQSADSITSISSVLHGTITYAGTQYAATRGFKYYQSADCSGTENDRSENGDFGDESYSLNLTGITSNTLFSYKAYATSPAGTGTSAACEAFTTLSSAPTVTAQVASALVQTTATLNGNITTVDGANATERGFNVYNGAVCAGGSIQNPKDTGGSYSAGAFSKGATGLTLNTAYSYTAYAINTGGTGTSGCQSFATLVNIPDSPTVNYDTDASLTIIINPNLNSAGTLFAIQNVTAGQYVQANGSLGAGEVWQTRVAWGGDSGIANTGLNANTQYTYKVKAKNDADIETALSDGVAKYTGASNPGAVVAIALSSSSIKVDWTSGGAQNKFNVYRGGQSGVGTLVHSANDLTYTDNELTASTAYTYYVYSVNEDGVENSNFTSATVSTPAVTVSPVITPSPTPSPSVTTAPSSEESAIPQNTNTAKVDYTSPTANISISQDPSTFVTGTPISFDASGSTDDIKITKYEWDFGDGETSDMVKVNHQYEKPGRYTVALTVYDKEGNKSVATQTIDIKPSIPTISNITAKGTNLFIEGKSDPDTLVYFTIHSETFNGQGIADKHGYWTYNLENASDVIGQGSHTIFALAAVKLADNSEIRGAESKTYDFNLTVDNGKLKVEMKKTRTWQYISLGLILLIVAGFVLRRFRKGKLINR